MTTANRMSTSHRSHAHTMHTRTYTHTRTYAHTVFAQADANAKAAAGLAAKVVTTPASHRAARSPDADPKP